MESASRTVPRGTFYIGLQGASNYLVSFLSYVVLTRILTPFEIGELPLLSATWAAFSTLGVLSVNIATTKFVSEFVGSGQTQRVFGVTSTAAKLVGAVTIPGFLLLGFLSPQLSELIFGTATDARILTLVVLTASITNFGAVLVSVLWGLNLFGRMVAANLVGLISGRVLGILLAALDLRLEGYVTGWVLGAAVTLALGFHYSRPYLKRPSEKMPASTMLNYSYPVLFSSLVGLVQNWADVTVFYALTGNLVYTGVYYLALAGAGILSPITTALTNAIFPTLSSRHGRGEAESFRSTVRIAERAINVLLMPISFGLAAIAGTAVTVAYGRAYLGAALPFAIVIASSIIGSYSALMGFVLQATGRTQPLIKIAGAGAITELGLTAALVLPLNVLGSAIARLGMIVVTLLLTYRYVKGQWWPSPDRSSLAQSIFLSALVFLGLFAFDSLILSRFQMGSLTKLLLDAAVFLAICLGGLIALKPLHPEDVDLIKAAVPPRLHGLISLIEQSIMRKH